MRESISLEEIEKMWETDRKMFRDKLSEHNLDIPNLHGRYMTIYNTERIFRKTLKIKKRRLYMTLRSYFSGTLDKMTLDKYGWIPYGVKVLKSDLDIHIESHEDFCDIEKQVEVSNIKINLLEQILRLIMNRGFQIKNEIELVKWESGII